MERSSAGREQREAGHLMAGLMAALAIMLIFSTVIFQSWEEVLRRDNEAEMIFRAQDIVRSISRYRKDLGTTPEKLEDLMEAGPRGQFYLRKLYTDPLVKNGKWGLLYAGPGATIIDPSVQGFAGDPTTLGLPGLGGAARGGEGAERTTPAQRGRGEEPRADPRREEPDALQGETPIDAGGRPIGLRLAGVKSLCEEEPFRVYRGFTEYSQWLFTYLDLEQLQIPGQTGVGGEGQGRGGDQGQPGIIRPSRQTNSDRQNPDRPNPNRGGGRNRQGRGR